MSKHEEHTDMKVLKATTTKSVSGRSSLTYQLGCNNDNKLHIRITKNSGNGFFNSSWYSMDDIQTLLSKSSENAPLTSYLLEPLIKGSANTPAFVMAALTNERLLRVLKGKKCGHEFLDPEDFNARMQKLVSAKAKPKGTKKTAGTVKKTGGNTAGGTAKKAAVKKKAVSRRKTSKTV